MIQVAYWKSVRQICLSLNIFTFSKKYVDKCFTFKKENHALLYFLDKITPIQCFPLYPRYTTNISTSKCVWVYVGGGSLICGNTVFSILGAGVML